MNVIGSDLDRKDLAEAMTYFSRFLTRGKYKHTLTQSALTAGKHNIPCALYTLADTKEHFAAKDTRTLQLWQADAALCGTLLKKKPADILVCDLPYGVQHAPQSGAKTETFPQLLNRLLPAWHQALKPGGAMALSYNTLTLPRKKLAEAVTNAGFTVLTEAPYGTFEHYVEQAVTRDLLIATLSCRP